MNLEKVNILVLNWRSNEAVMHCLNNIDCSIDRNFRVILINNFSSNEDLLKIRTIYKKFEDKFETYLVENELNLGYAGGNNSGYRFLAQNNFLGNILILNPDVLIAKDTIREMRKALAADIGIVTTRTLDDQGSILYDAIQCNGFTQRNVITSLEVVPTDISQGSCLLVRREMLDKIGFFDEKFFLYWEEVDFSLRVKEIGYKLISITTSHVVRKNNSDLRQPAAFYYSVRNARLIKSKHKLVFTNQGYCFYLVRIFFTSFKFASRPRLFFKVIASYFSGILDSMRNRYYEK